MSDFSEKERILEILSRAVSVDATPTRKMRERNGMTLEINPHVGFQTSEEVAELYVLISKLDGRKEFLERLKQANKLF